MTPFLKIIHILNIIFTFITIPTLSTKQILSQNKIQSGQFKTPILWGWERELDNDTEESIYIRFKRYKENGLGGINYSTKLDHYPRAIKVAKDVGLKIFAWYTTLLADFTHKPDFFYNYPNDYVVNRQGINSHNSPLGPSYYRLMCPSSYNTKKYLLKKFKSLSKLELDGVNLDYIYFIEQRWSNYKNTPFTDTCYCKRCLRNFTHQFPNVNTNNNTELSMNKYWLKLKTDLITNLAQSFAKVITKNGKQPSANVYPGPGVANWKVRQNWPEWSEMRILHPMHYQNIFGVNVEQIGKWAQEARSSLDNYRKDKFYLIPGIEVAGVSLKDFKKSIELISRYSHGVAFFELHNLTDQHWKIARSYIKKFKKITEMEKMEELYIN
jgi:hypothetical protein